MTELIDDMVLQPSPTDGPISVGNGIFTCTGRYAKYVSAEPDHPELEFWFTWPSLGKPEVIHPERNFPLSISIVARVGIWDQFKQSQPGLLQKIIEKCFLLQQVGGPPKAVGLVVDPAPLVVENSFSNLSGIPLHIVGIASDETLAAIEAGNVQVRQSLMALGRSTFGNAGLITHVGNNSASTSEMLAQALLEDDRDDDITTMVRKERIRLTLNLRVANKRKSTDSTLYNVSVKVPGGSPRRVVPHAYYIKKSWNNFSFIHATDLHISLRNDQIRDKLSQAEQDEAAKRYNNPNDAFRDLIHYANHLHDEGLLDFIMATGDLVDYFAEWPKTAGPNEDKSDLYVYDPVPGSQENLDLFIKLVLGRSPYPDPEMTQIAHEELRVPIFTTMGNHDYRLNSFPLRGKVVLNDDKDESTLKKTLNILTGGAPKFIDFIGAALTGDKEELLKVAPSFLHPQIMSFLNIKVKEINYYKSYNLIAKEAKALHGGTVPEISAFDADDAPLRFLEANREPITDLGEPYYIVRLGPHRLVMLDTGYDAGIFKNTLDTAMAYLGFASEDKVNLADGTPNSIGINDFEFGLVRQALLEADKDGLVIVGLHAPPLNPKGDEYPHYFRETEHPTADAREILGYLFRQLELWPLEPKLLEDWQLQPDLKLKPTGHFKSGGLDTLLDWGIASRIEGKTEEFLKLCVGQGIGITKKVDLVLFGHIHHRVEYRLDWDRDRQELRYYMDFYSQNPKGYYRSRKVGFDNPVHVRVTNRQTPSEVERVDAKNPDAFWPKWKRIDVPRYAHPLNSATDPASWWESHRPILAQTAALGPTEQNDREDDSADPVNPSKPGPSFQGFRVIFVLDNVIAKMRYVNLRNLRQNGFTMPWEKPGVDSGLPEEDFDGADQAAMFEA